MTRPLLLAALAAVGCSTPPTTSSAESRAAEKHPEVELTLALVDPAGNDVTAEVLFADVPKTVYLWRTGDTCGNDSREVHFGVPIRIPTDASAARRVQLAPNADDLWLKRGWGLAGDLAPEIVLDVDATGKRRLELAVAPMRRVRLSWTMPDGLGMVTNMQAWGFLAPANGACRPFDFQDDTQQPPGTLTSKQIDLPVGVYELWSTGRVGEYWPWIEMWAHETIEVSNRDELQSFVVHYKRGVSVEGRFVDRQRNPITAWADPITRSGGSTLFHFAPVALRNRSFGPPFHCVTLSYDLWNTSPDLGGHFKLAGLPPSTALAVVNTRISQPPEFLVPPDGGPVGDVVVRDE